MTLTLDVPGAMQLGVAALLWIVAGAYASTHLRDDPNAGRFAEWWLSTLIGNLGVFIAADLVSFYLTFSVVSLAAYGLIVHDGTPGWHHLRRSCRTGRGFPVDGFLVPLHVWMPLAYTTAPTPAAAVLSSAAVKAGVIGFIRFLPFGVAMPEWGEAMAAAGLFSAFCGVPVGITRKNPKTVLAYSSVSQMGLLAAALGMVLAGGDTDAVLGASFSASHHVLVKGGLFLAIGVAATAGAYLWPVLIPAAVLALGLGGLPLTGGALAKLAVKAQFGEGVVGVLTTLSAAASTLLMFHFLRRLVQTAASRL